MEKVFIEVLNMGLTATWVVFAVLAVLYILVPRLCKRKLSSVAMICIAAVLGIVGGMILP